MLICKPYLNSHQSGILSLSESAPGEKGYPPVARVKTGEIPDHVEARSLTFGFEPALYSSMFPQPSRSGSSAESFTSFISPCRFSHQSGIPSLSVSVRCTAVSSVKLPDNAVPAPIQSLTCGFEPASYSWRFVRVSPSGSSPASSTR